MLIVIRRTFLTEKADFSITDMVYFKAFVPINMVNKLHLNYISQRKLHWTNKEDIQLQFMAVYLFI